ncbi:hypothetical protein EVAR_20199_1 [Eumeta japonica]|uniref:Uncharacterized protein n=1 Tax=Eumeta variegata TaxID=151549 RepID=A0A4C1UU94_EUMVA|nr:hypothetical protein EVAR_20199_1 [Eumeta japonica]
MAQRPAYHTKWTDDLVRVTRCSDCATVCYRWPRVVRRGSLGGEAIVQNFLPTPKENSKEPVVPCRRSLRECPFELRYNFLSQNRFDCAGRIEKGGFSFEFHKYLPFFISKRKNYAHPLRIPRSNRPGPPPAAARRRAPPAYAAGVDRYE